MLLLSSPRCGRQHRASVPLLVAVLLSVVPASLPAHLRCPPPLDCVQQRRHQCQPYSSDCGPCLPQFEENEKGGCVLKRRSRHGKVTAYADLDEEIDFLHSVIEKQDVLKKKPSKTQLQHPASISLQTEVKDRKTNAPKQKQDRPSDETLRSSTAAPRPVGSARPNTPTPQPRVTGADNRAGPIVVPKSKNDTIIVIMISLCVVVGSVAVILATICFVTLQKKARLAEKVDYPAFRAPSVAAATHSGASMGDKSLAHSAQMYHYHHQKQQMLSMGNHKPEQKVVDSEVTSDEEEVGGGFTVYECPGLAPTGEMEVKNPLFDDSTIDYQGNHK